MAEAAPEKIYALILDIAARVERLDEDMQDLLAEMRVMRAESEGLSTSLAGCSAATRQAH